MSRRKVSLKAPPDDERELHGFPRSLLGPETPLWRVTREGHGPWWFSSAMTGRFDLPTPDGTCYLATEPLAALLEVLGPDRIEGTVTTEMLNGRRLHELRLEESRSCADLTSRQATGYGLTLEIHTCADYAVTQAWARALGRLGTSGLLYFARHDPSPHRSVALFGRRGEREEWHRGHAHHLESPEIAGRLLRECNIRVVPRPRLDQIQVLD